MYKQIKVLIDNYAKDDMPDQRAVATFKELESNESISTLKNELIGIKNGAGDPSVLKGMLGLKSCLLYTSPSPRD